MAWRAPVGAETSYSVAQRAKMLELSQWASDFSWEQMKVLARYLEGFTFPIGTIVMQEGEKECFLVLICMGEVEVFKGNQNQEPRVLARLGRGKVLGEVSLMDKQPRSASVRAATPCKLLILHESHFERLCEEVPRLALPLTLKLAATTGARLRSVSGLLVDHLESGRPAA